MGQRAGVKGADFKRFRSALATPGEQRCGMSAEQVRAQLRHTTTDSRSTTRRTTSPTCGTRSRAWTSRGECRSWRATHTSGRRDADLCRRPSPVAGDRGGRSVATNIPDCMADRPDIVSGGSPCPRFSGLGRRCRRRPRRVSRRPGRPPFTPRDSRRPTPCFDAATTRTSWGDRDAPRRDRHQCGPTSMRPRRGCGGELG
jgi:hypothetical protein